MQNGNEAAKVCRNCYKDSLKLSRSAIYKTQGPDQLKLEEWDARLLVKGLP